MNKIFKYVLENVDIQTIHIPLPARILSVMEKNDDIVLYSIVDDDKDVPTVSVDILVMGTGDFVEKNIGIYTFLGTVKLLDGKEIWHIFYRYSDNVRAFGQSDKLGEYLPLIEEFKRENSGKDGILVS